MFADTSKRTKVLHAPVAKRACRMIGSDEIMRAFNSIGYGRRDTPSPPLILRTPSPPQVFTVPVSPPIFTVSPPLYWRVPIDPAMMSPEYIDFVADMLARGVRSPTVDIIPAHDIPVTSLTRDEYHAACALADLR